MNLDRMIPHRGPEYEERSLGSAGSLAALLQVVQGEGAGGSATLAPRCFSNGTQVQRDVGHRTSTGSGRGGKQG